MLSGDPTLGASTSRTRSSSTPRPPASPAGRARRRSWSASATSRATASACASTSCATTTRRRRSCAAWPRTCARFRHLVTFNGKHVRHPAARVALPPEPRALPAGEGAATSTCCTRRAGCGRRGWSRAACRSWRRRSSAFAASGDVPGRGDPAHLLRLRAPARRPRAWRACCSTTGSTCLAGRAGRAGLPVGRGRPRRGPARRARPRPRPASGRRCSTQSEAHYRRAGARGTPGPCGCPRCCAWPRARSAGGDFSVALPLWEEAAERATGGRCASWPCHHEHREPRPAEGAGAGGPRPRPGPGARRTRRRARVDFRRRRRGSRQPERQARLPQASSACGSRRRSWTSTVALGTPSRPAARVSRSTRRARVVRRNGPQHRSTSRLLAAHR